jgi:hypothetical protein
MAENRSPDDPRDDDLPDEDERTAELVSYLDGELSPEEADEIEAELGRDKRLRGQADSLKRAWDLLDFLPRSEPSSNFTERTLSQIAPLQNLPATGSSLTRSPSLSNPARTSGSGTSIVPVATPTRSGRVRVVGWAAALALFGLFGWFVQRPLQQLFSPRDDKNADAQLLSELRLLKNLKFYRHIDDISFLQALDQPELFAEEPFARD